MRSVSVIIPAQNASRWIADAIHSAARQTAPPREIIVIDNASSDETCALVERVKVTVPSVTLVRNPRDLGPAASRNIGIERALGDWLGFLDADDWFAPERLQVLLDLAMREDVSIVADNQFFTRGADRQCYRTLIAAGDRQLQRIGLEAFLRRDGISAIGNLGLLKPLVRRQFLMAAKIRYDEDRAIVIGEDSLFYIRCLLAGAQILLTNEPLYFYRQHSESLSRYATVQSLRVLRDKNRTLLAPARSAGAPSLVEAIDQRFADFDDMLAYRELALHIRAARWFAAVSVVVANWSRWLFLLRRGVAGGVNRLRIARASRPIGRAPPLISRRFLERVLSIRSSHPQLRRSSSDMARSRQNRSSQRRGG